mgnify:CR=1 FL=1
MEGERKRSSLCISDRRTGPNPTFIFPQSFELCNDTSSSIVPPFFSRPSPLSSDKMSAAKQDGALAEARHWFAQNKLKAVGKEGRKEKQQRFECRRASDIASRRPRGESQRPPPTSPLSLFRHPPPNLLIVPPPPNPPQPPGTFWASSVAGVLAYQWSKPIPTNLKIIHARVAAQALTLGALAAAAAVDFYEHKAELERVGVRLEDVEKKVQKVHGAEK